MSPVILNDVLAAVGVLSALPPDERAAVLSQMLLQAETGHRYREIHNRAHPEFGDGTLSAVALRYPERGSTGFRSADTLSVWILVLEHLATRAQGLSNDVAKGAAEPRCCASCHACQ